MSSLDKMTKLYFVLFWLGYLYASAYSLRFDGNSTFIAFFISIVFNRYLPFTAFFKKRTLSSCGNPTYSRLCKHVLVFISKVVPPNYRLIGSKKTRELSD